MIKIYRITPEGYYIEGNDGLMENGDTPPDDYVIDAPPAEYAHARYVGGTWIDEVPPPPPPTDSQRITALEQTIEELAARIEALENPTP